MSGPMDPSRKPALAAAIGGSLAMLVMMAQPTHIWRGPLWGIIAAFVAAWGWTTLWAKGASEAVGGDTSAVERVEVEPALKWGIVAALSILAVGVTLGGYPYLPITLLLSLLALAPAALTRPALLVFVGVLLMYLPLLGTFSLWDPWETHYGEVAREILARDDWISLWWAQDNWFWSKPILIFWMEALTMGAFGVDFLPDANPAYPEWAIRLPVLILALIAVMAIFFTVRRIFSTRAGVLAALVVATTPHFFFLSHQAITDMPMVATASVATCLLMLAIQAPADALVGERRVGPFKVSPQHVMLGAIALVALPQILYLITRNISLVDGWKPTFPRDEFLYGSAGNPDVPGNPSHATRQPFVRGFAGQPFLQGIFWLGLLTWLSVLLRKERRSRRLLMYGFYFFCALALMGKGLPGIVLPGLAALFYLIASGRWRLLSEGHFAIAPGTLVVAVVGLPWYVAMYFRHGPAFTNRLLIHDHINRLAAGVHGDTGSVQYFVEQLGYATFPWVALIPLAAVIWLKRRDETSEDFSPAQRDTLLMTTLWFVATFVLFSAMATKFHHYIFPATVPIAILAAITLDRMWGGRALHEGWSVAGSILAVALLVVGFAVRWGAVRGVVPEAAVGTEDWVLQNGLGGLWSWLLILSGVVVAIVVAVDLTAAHSERTNDAQAAAVGVALLCGAGTLAFVGRDLSWATTSAPQGYERLIDLFVYNYKREWPAHFDYRPILTGFAIVATLVVLLAAVRFLRPLMARMLLGLAVLFTVWALNVYMIDLSPHWGQQGLVKRYYAERAGPEEPLVAWQMNWKGENFYSGNRVYAFVKLDNKEVKKWLAAHRTTPAFFMFEHKRLGSFKRIVGGRHITELTNKRDCNKFMLVKLEPAR